LTGSITLDGASVPISLTRIGQTARYTFSGTSGQWVSWGMTGVTIPSTIVSLLKPDGTTLTATGVYPNGGGLEPPGALPVNGTYTFVVDPWGTNTGTTPLTLMSYLRRRADPGRHGHDGAEPRGRQIFLFIHAAGARVERTAGGIDPRDLFLRHR
jgi:hypothetical protein